MGSELLRTAGEVKELRREITRDCGPSKLMSRLTEASKMVLGTYQSYSMEQKNEVWALNEAFS